MSIFTKYESISTLSVEGESFDVVLVDADCFRLIPSRFPPVALYERVAANDQLDEVVEAENLTNPRLKSAQRLAGGFAPIDETSPRLQNWNLAPFAYSNPEGSTYFRPLHRCLELGEDLQTALALSVQRREAFLLRTAEAPIGLDMRVLKTPVKGRMLDLRPRLVDADKARRWALGDRLLQADFDGILFCSPARPSATCVGVLKGTALGRSQQTKHFRFIWSGKRISTLYAFDDAKEVAPEDLAGEAEVIAA